MKFIVKYVEKLTIRLEFVVQSDSKEVIKVKEELREVIELQTKVPKSINDHFETMTFESIFVNAVRSAQNEVVVTLKVDLNRNDNCLTALKAKLDTGAQGNILPLRNIPQNVASSSLPKSGNLENSTTILTACVGMKIVQHDVCNTPGWYLKAYVPDDEKMSSYGVEAKS